MMTRKVSLLLALAGGAVGTMAPAALAQEQPEFPPFADVSKDYTKVVSTADGEPSLYTVWTREKDGQMLAELPRGWQSQKHLFAMTVPTGELFAGLQAGDMYVYWKRFDKRVALVAPNIQVRSTGDAESKDSIKNHFTDRVLIDVPIVCMGPNGQPVIDMDALLAGSAGTFYGFLAQGANPRLATVAGAKAFPHNVELSFEMPVGDGTLKTFHYSISLITESPGYQPRNADERVGYFTTEYRDLGKFQDDKVATRYINRWHLEKADPKLKLSPPKQPLVFYIEHTVPVRYRRWVKEGVLYWNDAYAKIGLNDAIEVYYQDKATGAHMDKDPEDVRYNFIRWLSNDIGTAIGPSRANPITGEILDADIVLTDGWIRHFWYQANELLPDIAMEGMGPETLAWLDKHPNWDPRVRLAPPEQRDRILAERARAGILGFGGQAILTTDGTLANSPELQRLAKLVGPQGGLCMAAQGMARNMAIMGLNMEVRGLLDEPQPGDKPGDKADGKDQPKKDEADLIDGIPEWFVGPALAHLTVHEVGHTLGLRHNFKASSIHSLAKINSAEMKGGAITGSVMDYTPVNINMNDKCVQGDYNQVGVGPYDMWAIEYGYTTGDPAEVLKRVSEPELAYQTDEDTGGPDPLARRYDFSADPIDYAVNQMKLAKFARERIIDKFVKAGESWSKARRGYAITLGTQANAVSIMANWVGGSFINRDHKGDPGDRAPIAPVPVAQQRAALKFVIENTFYDQAFGLTPELLARMTVNKDEDFGQEPTWAVHDRISGIQASALTMLMNPTTLRRVYDNEFYVPANQDMLTLPELIDTVSTSIWSEIDAVPDKRFTAREPMISSLRRNLQREHMERLIDLSFGTGSNAASKPIANLSTAKLRELSDRIDKTLKKADSNIDPYTKAHLSEATLRIQKALDAQYIYNQSGGYGGFGGYFFGQTTGQPAGLTQEEAK